MKSDGFGMMLFVSFGMAGLTCLFYKTGLPEAGLVSAVFCFFMLCGAIVAKCLDRKK